MRLKQKSETKRQKVKSDSLLQGVFQLWLVPEELREGSPEDGTLTSYQGALLAAVDPSEREQDQFWEQQETIEAISDRWCSSHVDKGKESAFSPLSLSKSL